MGIVICGLILALACNNEIVSLILLLIAVGWGLIKLFNEMDKGGYR